MVPRSGGEAVASLPVKGKTKLFTDHDEIGLELALAEGELRGELAPTQAWLLVDALDDGPDALQTVREEPFSIHERPSNTSAVALAG